MDFSHNRLDMKNSLEHPRRKSREAVMMALYALEIHKNVNEKSETSLLSSTSILDDILSRRSTLKGRSVSEAVVVPRVPHQHYH